MARRLGSIGIACLLAGLAWVLPPHVLGGVRDHYPPGMSTWVGDGLWNAMPFVTAPILLAIGFVFGYFNPKDWFLAWAFALWIQALGLGTDFYHDPTSHNLWPFEVVLFAIWNAPMMLTAGLGARLSRRAGRRAKDTATAGQSIGDGAPESSDPDSLPLP